ncbi:MAG: PhzF family phenazine biosynthesis protein [Myxococcota bacterium]
MATPYCVIDAFTAEPFGGNPAAVCWLEQPREPAWMQAVAAEMNLSETAFVGPGEGACWLRWFTPTVEVPLCGHATLASAHFLYTSGRLERSEPARFDTKSGRLLARAEGDRIVLDFPAFDAVAATPAAALVAAVGVQPIECARVDRPGTDACWIFALENEGAVRAARPDFARMVAVSPEPVVLTARATSAGFDFVSRFFAPGHGIGEDPVTGSAHCMLGPWWQAKLGRESFVALQASARQGVVHVRSCDGRIELAGQAVTVAEGRLLA